MVLINHHIKVLIEGERTNSDNGSSGNNNHNDSNNEDL